MAVTDTHAAPHGIRGETGALSGLIARLRGRVARYLAYRRSLAELQVLSDRDLRDVGVNRSMIRSIAYEQAYRSF